MIHAKNARRRFISRMTAALVLALSPAALADDATPAPTTTTPSTDATPIPATSSARPSDHDTVTLYQSIHPHRPLLVIGGAMFLGSYSATAAFTAANTDGGGDRTMYLPVVGPWLHLKDIDESTSDTLLIAGSGVLQGAGLGLAIASLFIPEKIPAATIQAGSAKINVVPASYGRGSGGIGAVGVF